MPAKIILQGTVVNGITESGGWVTPFILHRTGSEYHIHRLQEYSGEATMSRQIIRPGRKYRITWPEAWQ